MNEQFEHHFIKTNGITLHVVIAGTEEGPPLFLLHGFPEFWYGWHNQIPYLAKKGYRVIVPDQRGYNLSDKPKGIAAYHLNHLAADIVGLIDALGYDSVYLAGHDWGAAVSWWLATHHPERLKKMAILNVPYPTMLMHAFRERNWEQMRKSWYMIAFQIPWLAEYSFRKQNEGNGRNILLRISKEDTFSEEDLAIYEKSWEKSGAITGMLNWYRNAGRTIPTVPTPAEKSITVPTLMLWGEQDKALGTELITPSIALCANGEAVTFPDATHWLQHDEAEAINKQFSQFFR